MLKGIEELIDRQFSFTILKKRFTYLVYRHLKRHNWKYLMLVFEGKDSKGLVAIMFHDEHGYFRRLEVPLPILLRDAEKAGKADDPLLSVAKEILEEAKTAKRLPLTLWGKIPAREIYRIVNSL